MSTAWSTKSKRTALMTQAQRGQTGGMTVRGGMVRLSGTLSHHPPIGMTPPQRGRAGGKGKGGARTLNALTQGHQAST